MSDNVYWTDQFPAGQFPSILAIGDSWFWYPFPGGSLLNQLGPLVSSKEHIIYALGFNGAEAVDLAEGKHNRMVRTALRLHGKSLSAVFISAGGNDFAGVNDLQPLLKLDCSGAQDAKGCFRPGDHDHTLNWLMRKTSEHYTSLIGQVMAAGRPDTLILLHNYDYAIPSGKGVFGRDATWLRQALVNASVPETLHGPCTVYVIDQLTKVLTQLVKNHPARILLVDGRNCLKPEQWANELHPTPAGFRSLARERWLPKLRDAGLAK